MMKTNIFPRVSAFAWAGLMVALVFGCSKQQATQAPQKTSPVSVEKTSFDEVTSQLDPGGDFYLYLGIAQWTENLSGHLDHLRDTFTSLPSVTDEQRDKINQGFNIIDHL